MYLFSLKCSVWHGLTYYCYLKYHFSCNQRAADSIPHRKMTLVILNISQKLLIYLFLRPWCCEVTRLTACAMSVTILQELHWNYSWKHIGSGFCAGGIPLLTPGGEGKQTSLTRHLGNIRSCCCMWIYEYSTDITDNSFLKIPVFRWCCLPKIHTGSSVSGNSSK